MVARPEKRRAGGFPVLLRPGAEVRVMESKVRSTQHRGHWRSRRFWPYEGEVVDHSEITGEMRADPRLVIEEVPEVRKNLAQLKRERKAGGSHDA